MKIAIHVNGDWNDAEVQQTLLGKLVADGSIWPSGNTGQQYGEEIPLPIYEAGRWPSAGYGLLYVGASRKAAT